MPDFIFILVLSQSGYIYSHIFLTVLGGVRGSLGRMLRKPMQAGFLGGGGGGRI